MKLPSSWLKARTRPFFVYDRSQLRENARRLRSVWSSLNNGSYRLYYSLKANPNPHLLAALDTEVDGFDVSSLEELELLERMKISGSRITISGPAKIESLIQKSLRMGVKCIHLDGPEELAAVQEVAAEALKTKLTLRLRDPALPSAKLGFGESSLRELLGASRVPSFSGIHMYLGRESFSAENVLSRLDQIAELRAKFANAFTPDFEVYLGPGIPSWTALGDDFDLWKGSARSFDFPVNIEAGRAIAGTAGQYGGEVLAVKPDSSHRDCLIFHGGVQHLGGSLLSPSFGGTGVSCEAFRRGEPLEGEKKDFAVYGSLCLANDIIHPKLLLPSGIRRGDWILFHPCGAYGLSAASNQFIGQVLPQEFIFDSAAPGEPKEITAGSWKPYLRSFDV